MNRPKNLIKRRSKAKRLARPNHFQFEPLEPRRYLSITPAAAPFPLVDTFKLHSLPTATKVIYLDFDGHTTTDTLWNSQVTSGNPITTPAFSMDSDPAFSDEELERIQYIWERVREDFAPFNVDVTTEDPGVQNIIKSSGGDLRYGVRVAIGGLNSDWYNNPDVSGVAFGSFGWDTDTPAMVFSGEVNESEKGTAEVISHEVGHALGLDHDGQDPSTEYYGGHGAGVTGWAPIMGAGFSENLTQWSKGEYQDADNNEDDLNIITTGNGFGYRGDDFGNSIATATELQFVGNSFATTGGIIERNSDVDYFYFSVVDTSVVLNIDSFYRGPNLDILATLYDSTGTVIATSNPLNEINANFTQILTTGIYYLSVDGTGKPINGSDLGYSDYGSLGQYTISGTVTTVDLIRPTVDALNAPTLTTAGGTTYTFDVTYVDNVAINHNTIGNNDVRVTGPNGYDVIATFVSVDVNSFGTPRTGTYQITAPGGAWNAFDTGLYTVTVQANAISDTGGNTILETVAGTFIVNIQPTDIVAPTITISSPTEGQVFVDSPISLIGNVVDTGGSNIGFISLAVNGSNSDVLFFPANVPASSYTFNDIDLADGINTLTVQAFDRAGNASIPVSVTVIYVSDDSVAPFVSGFSASNVTLGGANTYTFQVTYSDILAVDVSKFDGNDIRVTGPNGFSRLATFVSVDVDFDGTPRTVTYRFTTPGGTWDIGDNGTYTITVRPGQVSDPSENYMAETVVTTFDVAILAALPAVPSGVAASDSAFTDKVQVTWDTSVTATAYEVWRNTTNNSATATKITLVDVVNTTFDDTTANPGTTYWYWVKAKNTGGTTEFSVADAGMSFIPPAVNSPKDVLVLGSVAGDGTSRVKVLDAETGDVFAKFAPYGNSFRGGIHVAIADLNGDGEAEIITAPGEGTAPIVKVFTLAGGEIGNYRFRAYPSSFTGGVFVATGDVDGDGRVDIITTPGPGRAIEVRVWKNLSGIVSNSSDLIPNDPMRRFRAFGSDFKGGATVAGGDLTGDGKAEIVVGRGSGKSPKVHVFDTTTFATTELAPRLVEITPFKSGDRGGVSVAVGNVRGDDTPEIIIGNGKNGRGRVELYYADGSRFKSFTAYTGSTKNAPVNVAVKEIDGNDGGLLEVVTSQGQGGNRYRKFWQPDATLIDEVLETDLDFSGKYFVA